MPFSDNLSDLLPTSFGAKKSESRPAPKKSSEATVVDDGWDALRSMMPMSFGKSTPKKNLEMQFEKTKRSETDNGGETETVEIQKLAKRSKYEDTIDVTSKKEERDNSEDEDEDEDEDEEDYDSEEEDANGSSDILPISHEIKLSDHNKTVSALALDPSGSRLLTGSYDYEVKFWDFAGMDAALRPFRTIEPVPGHQLHDLHYSISGDSFLIITGSAKAKIYNRDGYEIQEFAKGDPYIRDMRNTDGHVAALTAGCFHPTDRTTFLTASQDSTIRIWDAENKRKQKQVIVAKSKERGGRTSVTAAVWSTDAKIIGGACSDGTLNLWDTKGTFARPSHTIEKAHSVGTETSSIIFSMNQYSMITRGGDDTVKVWDIRNFKKSVAVADNLPTMNPETNVIFSPDERLILTGTAAKKGDDYGKVVMLDRETLDIRRTINITKSSVVKVLWHSKINQIVTGSADGTAHVFYSPQASVRGAKLCILKTPKYRAVDDNEIDRPIITPHALPMYRDQMPKTMKRKREKVRADPIATRKPEMPIKGAGKGGKLGTNETHHIMQTLIKDNLMEDDPREALLKYAQVAEEEPLFISTAYKKTQPKAILADETGEDPLSEPRRRGQA